MKLAEEIKTKFPNYLELAECCFNRSHDLWERPMYQSNATFLSAKSIYGIDGINKVTTREQIINLFLKKKYYDGFLCAMVWGNIGTFQNGREHFESAFSANRDNVIKAIENVQNHIIQGKVEDAYDSMCRNGENYIPGIGVSFFTKVLYFVGASCNCIEKPLIFDSTSIKILNRIYHDNKVKGKAYQSYRHYHMFNQKMAEISTELQLPTPGHLEAFLFNCGKCLIESYED